jgi:hypothetical protein
MRAFVFIRQYALHHQDLAEKLIELEKRYDKKFQDIIEAINYLLRKEQEIIEHHNRKRIGFKQDKPVV